MTVSVQAAAPATTLQLAPEHLVELHEARALVRRSWRPMLDVRREHFVLPTLGPRLYEASRDLDHASGHLVLRGLGTGCPEPDLSLLLWGVGRHVGVAVPQDVVGRLVLRVDAGERAFHSGGSDVTALLAAGGGLRVSLVHSHLLYAEIERRRPDLAGLLSTSVPFAVAGEGYRVLPLTCRTGGRLSVRYDRDAIEAAQRDPEAPRLSGPHRELLDLVDALLPELQYDVHLHPGDALLVNNHEVLHRVGAGLVGGGPLRLWLTLRDGRPLPYDYLWPTPTYGERGGRGGVIPSDVIHDAAAA